MINWSTQNFISFRFLLLLRIFRAHRSRHNHTNSPFWKTVIESRRNLISCKRNITGVCLTIIFTNRVVINNTLVLNGLFTFYTWLYFSVLHFYFYRNVQIVQSVSKFILLHIVYLVSCISLLYIYLSSNRTNIMCGKAVCFLLKYFFKNNSFCLFVWQWIS